MRDIKFFMYLAVTFIPCLVLVFLPTVAEAYYAEENDNNLRKHMKE